MYIFDRRVVFTCIYFVGGLIVIFTCIYLTGGLYGSSLSTLKSRLSPYLGSAYFGADSVTADTSLAVLLKEREVFHSIHTSCSVGKHYVSHLNVYENTRKGCYIFCSLPKMTCYLP